MTSDAGIRIAELRDEDDRHTYLSQLRQTFELMSRSTPFGVLGLAPEEADVLSVRRAYLNAAKLYHPSRYARCGRETVAVAQEVYLLVRRAFDMARVRTTRRPPGVRTTPVPPDVLKDQMKAAAEALHAGRHKAARERYHRLSAANPRAAGIRALYHYARGLELRDAGDAREARRELERALAADPSLEPARRALDEG